MTKRLCAHRPFPSYAFVPGKNPHPLKEGGHSFASGEPHTPPMDENRPYDSEDFLFALDLFNFGYYWETHMYLEALWNAHKRTGDLCHLFLAIIKLSAAGIKWQQASEKATTGHLERAIEHLQNIQKEKVAGFVVKDLIELIKNSPPTQLKNGRCYSFVLIPLI